MNINSNQVRSFFVQGGNLLKNASPKILVAGLSAGVAIVAVVVKGIAIYNFDKKNQKALNDAESGFTDFWTNAPYDRVLPSERAVKISTYQNNISTYQKITEDYQKEYDKLGSISKLFSDGHILLQKANDYIAQANKSLADEANKVIQTPVTTKQSITLDSGANRKVELTPEEKIAKSENLNITLALNSRGVSAEIAELLLGKITDKERESVMLFVKGINTTFDSGAATFVEEDFISNYNHRVSAGWHSAEDVAAYAAPNGQQGEYSKTTTMVVNVIKQKRSVTKMIRSIPAFSNAHDRLTFTEKPVKIYDPISGKGIELCNSELAFQYQKFITLYFIAAVKGDDTRIKEIKKAAQGVLNEFKAKDPLFCQAAGREDYCPMNGYGDEGIIKGSEAYIWEKVKGDAMKRAVESKLKSRPDLVIKLLLTDDQDSLTFIKPDAFWGTGLDGKGQDQLAKTYEEIRLDLRELDLKGLKNWLKSATGNYSIATYIAANYK